MIRQLENDPLRNPKPVEFSEQWRHMIVLPGTEYYPSSGVEDGLQLTNLVSRYSPASAALS